MINSPVFLPTNASYTFGNFNNLTNIEGLEKVDTSNTKIMDGLFAEDHNLENGIDISNWNTTNVVSMNQMFNADKKINSINLNGIDTSRVENMYGMFANCYNLESVNGINELDYSNVTNMKYWFAYDVSLDTLDLSNVSAPNVQNVDYMFINDVKLRYLDLSKFSTKNIDNGKMFWFQVEQPYEDFPYNNQPDKIKSHLIFLVTGTNFDGRKIRFESFGGNRKIIYVENGQLYQADTNDYDNTEDNNSNYNENIVKIATDSWRGTIIKFVDKKTNNQIGNTLLAQGLANISSSPFKINIPSGYALTDENANIINFDGSEDTNSTKIIYVSKKLNVIVNLKQDGKVIKRIKIEVPEGTDIDVSNELPSGYKFISSPFFNATDDQTEKDLEIKKIEDDTNSSSNAQSSASSSAHSEAGSNESSSSQSSASSSAHSEAGSNESSSAQSSASSSAHSEAGSNESSSAQSSASSSAHSEAGSNESSSAQSSASSSAHSEAGSNESSSTQSSTVSNANSNRNVRHQNNIKKHNSGHENNAGKPFHKKFNHRRVYMVKGFYRYSTATFYKKNRVKGYKKHERSNAVMFTIEGEAKSKHGLRRYKVYQIVSKKAGLFRVDRKKWGYITAKPSYMKPLYYSKNVHKVKVIGKGLRVYKNSKLSKYVKSYKRGTVLKVKAVKKLGTTYRLQLSDGRYVSSNKNLVKIIK
ncbi:BspA family leucine-rich repeat surface protein [Apilactobacillus kunkeei]|uniref:BspA family leucine-rich repeat surface protein n=1 Tax=Apilactobacillus kunkeei TaxID=148814 RepID=UPI0015E83F2C|nr:BspA family leucine-rich repeat surface protein [Apilactobacillus kunkeei]